MRYLFTLRVIRKERAMSSNTTNNWLTNAWLITKRDMLHWKHQPWTVLIGWFFPIMTLLLFGTLFGGAMDGPQGTSYYDFLVPGVLVMVVLFSIETTLLAMTTDASKGVTDRFRSMPIGASAVVLGRCIADMLNSIVGVAIMIGAGLLVGWEWHNGLGSFAVAVGLLFLLRFALLWVGIFIALKSKGPESVATAQIMVWPVAFLSSIFVNPATMPTWLAWIVEWNPVSVTATAMRELFGNPSYDGLTWAGDNAVLVAVLLPLLIIAVFMPLSMSAYANLRK